MRGYNDVEDVKAIKRVSSVEADGHRYTPLLQRLKAHLDLLGSPSHVLYYFTCYSIFDRLPACSR